MARSETANDDIRTRAESRQRAWTLACAQASGAPTVLGALFVGLSLFVLDVTSSTANQLAPKVHGQMYLPSNDANGSAVIVLHGRSGVFPEWKDYAEMLASNGYRALLLDYYARTGPAPSRDDALRAMSDWTDTIRHSVDYLKRTAQNPDAPVGVVGFSRGGFVGVHAAGMVPGIKAVVVYYGGATPSLDDYIANLPPILLLHGEDDRTVPVRMAISLHDSLKREGKPVEMHVYPRASHCFNCESSARNYFDAEVSADAQERTLEFLEAHLTQ